MSRINQMAFFCKKPYSSLFCFLSKFFQNNLYSINKKLLFFLWFLFLPSLFFLSFSSYSSVQSTARLISPFKSTPKNSTIDIGIQISIPKGWHTYWKNPGDIGQALKVHWTLPSSVKKPSALKWPFPKRIFFNQWVNFGYTRNLLVTSSLRVPSRYKEESLPIEAHLKWILCKNVCIPFEKKLSLSIPIEKTVKTDLKIQKLFERSKKKQAHSSNLTGSIYRKKNQYYIEIKSPEEFDLIDFFPFHSLSSKNPNFTKKSPLHYELILPTTTSEKILTAKALVVFKRKGQIHSSRVVLMDEKKEISIIAFILMALLGGLILNFMPCVLPVVFLKFYHLTKEDILSDRKSLIFSSISYAAGIIVSFLFLALLINLLKAGSEFIGWGFQMQSPLFVSSLILFFTFIGFNFLGLFHIRIFSKLVKQKSSNWIESFLTGFLATVSASPCTAPFMGASIGYAFSQSTFSIILIFTSLGLGMALPHLILCFFPGLLKKWPRPGSWNEKLKKGMAFPMLATTAWLFHILASLNPSWVFPLLISLVGFGFVLWLGRSKSKIVQLISYCVLTTSVLLALYPAFFLKPAPSILSTEIDNQHLWQKFSTFKLDQLRNEKQNVLLNFTAKWCLTCQWNEWTTFSNKKTLNFLQQNKIIMMKGDWTFKNDEISKMLEKHGRAGIPFTVFFPAGKKKPIVLPELLTSNILIKEIKSSL